LRVSVERRQTDGRCKEDNCHCDAFHFAHL
jgi:hypothetical protein